MFGLIFGNSIFSDYEELSVDESTNVFESIKFLPFELRDKPLYRNLTSITDYIIQTYHINDIKKISGLYEILNPDFDADKIIDLLGGSSNFVFPLNNDQKKTLIFMLSKLYEIKGLRKGVEAILRAFGIPAYIYESWEIREEVETGRSSRPDLFTSSIWTSEIERCSVAIVFDITGRMAIDGVEDYIVRAIESLLWACARIHSWIWLMNFRDGNSDNVGLPTDDVSFFDYFTFCDKFLYSGSTWCFLPRPILIDVNSEVLNRELIFFLDGVDAPEPIKDEFGDEILIGYDYDNDTYYTISKEIDGYDASDFHDQLGNFLLNPWKIRYADDQYCCPSTISDTIFIGIDSSQVELDDAVLGIFEVSDEIVTIHSDLVSELPDQLEFYINPLVFDHAQIKMSINNLEENPLIFYTTIQYNSGNKILDIDGNMLVRISSSYQNSIDNVCLDKSTLISTLTVLVTDDIDITTTLIHPALREDIS